MRNIILVSAAVAAVGLGAIFVGISDNEVQAQRIPMSNAVAECMLANIKSANSAAAVVFVLEACQVLN